MGGGGGGGGRFPGMGPGRGPSRRPRNNRVQNRQFDEVARRLGLNDKQRREFHDFISGRFDLNFNELLQLAREFFDMN